MTFKNWNHFPINKIYTPIFFTDIDNIPYLAQHVLIIFFQDNDCKCVYLFSISEPCDIPTKYRHKISTWWNYVNVKIEDVLKIMLNIKMFRKSIFNKLSPMILLYEWVDRRWLFQLFWVILERQYIFLCQLVLKGSKPDAH